jgi:6,7-dimethyl-8-ribityllumazine synthase
MNKKICIILSNYYPNISKNLLIGATNIIKNNKIKKIKIIKTSGVFEIPVLVSKNIKYFDAFIVLGCVIKGKTPHFDFISSSTINGIMTLSINYKKPIGNGILTCLNRKQAQERSDPKLKDKGGEAAKAVISILKLS